eukprot:3940988-Rhodomonas_salina.3
MLRFPTQCPVLTYVTILHIRCAMCSMRYTILLRNQCAMCGTEVGYAAARCGTMMLVLRQPQVASPYRATLSLRDVRYYRMRYRYERPDTRLGYAAICCPVLARGYATTRMTLFKKPRILCDVRY